MNDRARDGDMPDAAAAPVYIEDQSALADLCGRLGQIDWVALDTEFLRERTYYPKLCLLQLATPDWIACVDPLAIDDLLPLFEALERRELTKVMHACGQDLEIFHHLRGRLPGPVFDTQLAAPLLGHTTQIGYANLVRERLGVSLAKTQTRTDWSRRPLRPEQIDYAADDVRYLARLYPPMRAELAERGRLDWLAGDFQELLDSERYERPAADAWQRIKAWDRLDRRALAVLQALAEWREDSARRRDRPRTALLRDEQMLDLARLRPERPEQLAEIRNLPEPVVRRDGAEILARIAAAGGAEPRPHPQPRGAPPAAEDEALADALTAVIRLVGLQQQLNPASIASRKDILRLIDGQDSPLAHGWRRSLVGRDLRDLLDGRAVLRVRDGQLRLLADPAGASAVQGAAERS